MKIYDNLEVSGKLWSDGCVVLNKGDLLQMTDETPTEASRNFVYSGGVKEYVDAGDAANGELIKGIEELVGEISKNVEEAIEKVDNHASNKENPHETSFGQVLNRFDEKILPNWSGLKEIELCTNVSGVGLSILAKDYNNHGNDNSFKITNESVEMRSGAASIVLSDGIASVAGVGLNVVNPTLDSHAATKSYVDAESESAKNKAVEEARAATETAIEEAKTEITTEYTEAVSNALNSAKSYTDSSIVTAKSEIAVAYTEAIGEAKQAAISSANEYTNEAIAGVTQFDYKKVASLPATGEKGVIYLVRKASAAGDNFYDEYIWVDGEFEHIGDTQLSLDGYVQEAENNNFTGRNTFASEAEFTVLPVSSAVPTKDIHLVTKSYVDTVKSSLESGYTSADNEIKASVTSVSDRVTGVIAAYKDADTALKTSLEAAYKAADDVVSAAYIAADNAIKDDIVANYLKKADATATYATKTEVSDSATSTLSSANAYTDSKITELSASVASTYATNDNVNALSTKVIGIGEKVCTLEASTVTKDYIDTDFRNAIVKAYTDADAEVTAAYKSADAVIDAAYKAADAQIVTDYKAADDELRAKIEQIAGIKRSVFKLIVQASTMQQEWNINHNRMDSDVTVQVYRENEGDGTQSLVAAEVKIMDANNVKIIFNQVPETATFKAVIV